MIATAVVAAVWIARDGDLGDGQTLVAFVLVTIGVELALWRITVLDDRFVLRYADSPLEAWMSIAPSVFGLLLISPMRTPLDFDEPTGRGRVLRHARRSGVRSVREHGSDLDGPARGWNAGIEKRS